MLFMFSMSLQMCSYFISHIPSNHVCIIYTVNRECSRSFSLQCLINRNSSSFLNQFTIRFLQNLQVILLPVTYHIHLEVNLWKRKVFYVLHDSIQFLSRIHRILLGVPFLLRSRDDQWKVGGSVSKAIHEKNSSHSTPHHSVQILPTDSKWE